MILDEMIEALRKDIDGALALTKDLLRDVQKMEVRGKALQEHLNDETLRANAAEALLNRIPEWLSALSEGRTQMYQVLEAFTRGRALVPAKIETILCCNTEGCDNRVRMGEAYHCESCIEAMRP